MWWQSQVMQVFEKPTGEAEWGNGPHTWLCLRITWELGQDADSGASE